MSTQAIIFIVIAIVLGAVFMLRPAAGERVSAEQARALIEGGALLVDVRTPGEFASGHIKGAVNIPLGELSGRAGELGDKGGAVVLYCRSGHRSGQAARQLKAIGFTSLHDLGPMSAWR